MTVWRVVRRPSGCGRRHSQHRLPRAVPCALRPGDTASVLAIIAAPSSHAGHASVGNSRIFGDTQTSEAIVSLLKQHLVRLGCRPMQAQHRQHQR